MKRKKLLIKGDEMNRIILLVLISCCVASCAKPEEDDLLSSDGGDSCTYDLEYRYNLDVDPNSDFIDENVGVDLFVSNSTCAGLSDGYYASTTMSYISRVGNKMTIGDYDEYSGQVELIDIELNSNTVLTKTVEACVYGDETVEQITSGSLNSGTQKITIYSSSKVAEGACSDSGVSFPDYYQHTNLYGTWEVACNNGVEVWRSFYRNAAIEMTYYYDNASCTGSAFMYVERNGPHFTNGNEVDISYQNFFIKIMTASYVTTFNSNSICGKTNWTSGSDIDVSGLNCDLSSVGFNSWNFPADYEREYDVFQISGSSIKFGDSATGDKSSDAQRPTSLDVTSLNKVNYTVVPSWTQ